MYVGDKEVSKIYLGDNEVSGIYLGNKEVWQNVVDTPITLQNYNTTVVNENYPTEDKVVLLYSQPIDTHKFRAVRFYNNACTGKQNHADNGFRGGVEACTQRPIVGNAYQVASVTLLWAYIGSGGDAHAIQYYNNQWVDLILPDNQIVYLYGGIVGGFTGHGTFTLNIGASATLLAR